MASANFCSYCGAVLSGGERTCPHCGTPIAAVPPQIPGGMTTSAPPGSSAYPAAPQIGYEEHRAIDRTKTGVALLAVGSALGWIPVISLFGGLLALIGAIFVILGRTAFGPAHSRNVVIAIVLYLVGLFGVLILAASFIGQLEAAVTLPSSQVARAVSDAFSSFLIGAIVVGLFSGFAVVLFLYALLDLTGKILIWASFFASFGILVLVWAIISGQVAAATAAAFATSPLDPGPLLALDAQINSLRLLDIIPDLLMAGAAYTAYLRIDQGKIPARGQLRLSS